MSSLALLEAEKPSTLYVTGKNNLDVFLVLMVSDDAFPLCMDVVEVMVIRMVQLVSSMKRNAMEDDYYTEVESVPRSKAARGLERCR